ncbi:XdhC family protein [Bacillus sp. REN16]|uniref:XdhC family protein n=1 Tax=Bacillus sp. REN16 TaxID=2887296 RepID=UPI001E4E1505|nr:XdhC/CoxI family protein [Bacillus sp. REN16]MCC3357944.1 XdhC family protein [Bacillus sp. REN16]
MKVTTELMRCIQNNEKAVLATIIDKNGSSYRQIGAKSLILENGRSYGILSGGCVEQDLFEHAKEVFENGHPKQVIYDLRNDDDAPWGLGVGCNGEITIWLSLIDPINKKFETDKMLNIFNKKYKRTTPYTIYTVLQSSNHRLMPLGHMLEASEIQESPNLIGLNSNSGMITHTFLINNELVSTTLFLETITPTPNIVIFGAGPDAIPLIQQLKLLDWRVTVVDHRPGYLEQIQQSNVDDSILVPPRQFPADVDFHSNLYAVIMTHHYEQDLIYLEGLLHSEINYIGLLGPKKRFLKLKKDLEQKGISIPSKIENNIYTPIGLDIGSETPQEIALSIVAEIMGHKNNTSNRSLKFKKDSIHIKESIPNHESRPNELVAK